MTSRGGEIVAGQTQTYELSVTATGRASDVNVSLDLFHSQTSDLDVFLIAPDGTSVELLTAGGAGGENLLGTTLDDEAAQPISAGSGPFNGRFRPEGNLSDLDGKNVTGTWTLQVTNDPSSGDVGFLDDWSLALDLIPESNGNLNYDSLIDAKDIDLLYAKIGSTDLAFDLTGDDMVDQDDVDELVLNIMNRRYGDADLDADVDIVDFNAAALHFDPLDQNPFNGWTQGNFDGDRDVDISDIMRLVRNFAPLGYASPRGATLAVTPVVQSQPRADGATIVTPLHDTQEEIESADGSSAREQGANPRSETNRHSLDNTSHSAGEPLFVDDYFRAAQRKHRVLTETKT